MVPLLNCVSVAEVEKHDPDLAQRLVQAGADRRLGTPIAAAVVRQAGGDSAARLQRIVDRVDGEREASQRRKRDLTFALQTLGSGAGAAIGAATLGGPVGALVGAGAVMAAMVGAAVVNFFAGGDKILFATPAEPRQENTDRLLETLNRGNS